MELVMFAPGAMGWLCGWGIRFEESWGFDRQVAAWMMLLTPVWPLAALGWIVVGMGILVRAALGRDY